MAKNVSPLRYPGGRGIIYEKIKRLIIHNKMEGITYVEPFAGGFGIGLALLYDNVVKNVILNDFDIHIFNFWYSVLNYTEELIGLIEKTPINLEEREKQKLIYNSIDSSILEDGFATLFLNRVNFSGIIKAGPIGGYKQNGKYLLDCRFNKKSIIKKIRKISKYKNRIKLMHLDAKILLRNLQYKKNNEYFFYIDPPYVVKGSMLYTEYYKKQDHYDFAEAVDYYLKDIPWVMTYDKCDLILEIYNKYKPKEYSTTYNVKNKGLKKEYVITNLKEKKFLWD